MKYSIELIDHEKLIVGRGSGDASLSAFASLFMELLAPPFNNLDYDVIYDFRELNLAPLSGSDIKTLADIAARNRDKIDPFKQAIVVSNPVSYGIIRIFEAFTELAGFRVYRVFRSYEEAESWIAEGRKASS